MPKNVKIIVAVLLAFSASITHALSASDITVASALNQPLRANISLTNIGGIGSDEVTVRLAPVSEFQAAGIEYLGFLADIDFDVRPTTLGSFAVVVSSLDPIREPYVNFLLSIQWPSGRILKEYTILLDPVFGDTSLTSTGGSIAEKVREFQAAPQLSARPQVKRTANTPRLSRAGDSPSSVTVLPQDTLWGIAARVAPNGVSVHQTMHALKAANPDAFIQGNINGLKAGYVLNIPSSSQIQAIGKNEAIAATRDDTALWNSSVGAEFSRSNTVQTGRRGNLELAAAGDSDATTLNSEASALLDSANAELVDKVQSLEKQVTDLSRLLELKNQQLAILQDQAIDAVEATDDVAATGTGAVDDSDLADLTADEALAEVDSATNNSELASEDLSAVELAASQPLRPTTVQNFEVKAPLWLQPIPQLAALGVLFLCLIVLLLRRRDQQEESFVVEDEDVLLAAAEQQDFIPLPDDADPEDLDAFKAAFDEDGYDSAIVALEAQVEAEPHRADLRLLLLQKAAEADDKDRFVTNYRSLQAIGKDDDVAAGSRILLAVKGSNVWLEEDDAVDEDSDDFFKEIVHEAELTDEIEALLMASEGATSLDQQDVEDLDFEALGEASSLDEIDFDAEDELGVSLDAGDDIDVDLGSISLDEGGADTSDEPLADIDFEETLIMTASEGADVVAETSSETALDLPETDDEDDFDLDDALEFDLGEGMETFSDLQADDLADELDADDDELTFESTVAVESQETITMDSDEHSEELDIDVGSLFGDETEESEDVIDIDINNDSDDDAFDLDFTTADDELTELGAVVEGDDDDEEFLSLDEADDDFDLDSLVDTAADADAATELSEDLDLTEIDGLSSDQDDLDLSDMETIVVEADDDEAFFALPGEDESDQPSAEVEQIEAIENDTDDQDDFGGFLDDLDDEDIGDGDEIATKLELGEAFVEMEDFDAAREVLDEVLVEGNVGQQTAARELLDKITV